MPVKICHFTSVHSWNDIRIFQKMCTSLAGNPDFQVTLIAPDAPDQVVNGVHVIGVKKEKSSRAYRFLNLRKKIYEKALEQEADIYHFHDPELIPYGVKLQKKGKKVVFDSHEDVPNDILDKEWIKPSVVRQLISGVYNKYEKRATRRLSGVISVLDQITHKFTGTELLTVHNYPRLEEFGGDVPSAHVLPDRFNVVYNGGLTRIRGIHQLVESMRHLDDSYRLVLMGGWESEAYEKECRKSAGWDKVVYLGHVPTKECFGLLKKCQLGVVLFKAVPNHLNSLPNKSFEFIAAGLPMLMSDFPFWQQEFGEYAHFVDPEQPEAVARRIGEIRTHYSEEMTKVQQLSGRILQEKNWESEARKLEDFYYQLLKS
jgi:glycosyltransferase involved in cell wall biosynthesis